MWLFAIRYYINFDGDTKARPSRLSIAEESSSDVVLHSPSSAEEDVWTSKFYRPWIVRRRTGVSKFTVVVWKRAKKRRFSFLFQCKEAAFFARSWSKKSFANKEDKVAWKARKIEGSKNCGSEQGFSIRGNSQRFAIASEFFRSFVLEPILLRMIFHRFRKKSWNEERGLWRKFLKWLMMESLSKPSGGSEYWDIY